MGARAGQLPSFTVISPGFLTTVQDLGRNHCAHWGISPSGAADSVSLRLGNLLLNNPPNAPALEMTLIGGAFRFESPCNIALTGSDFGATLDGQATPIWRTVYVKPGQVLCCGPTKSGARCYLCVSGGIAVPQILSSASTHLLTALGGLEGRTVKAGDVLECGAEQSLEFTRPQTVRVDVLHHLFRRSAVGVTPGPQSDVFAAEAGALFSSSVYIVKEESNRMGLRLSGPILERGFGGDMTTEGVSLGAIQVPPNGEPIILFVEHPTTGGYPKIANVISADLHRVGQLRPRDEITFTFVNPQTAVALLLEREALLAPERCLQEA